MEHVWGYVIAGYSVAAVGLGTYAAWLFRRTRRLRRMLRGDVDG